MHNDAELLASVFFSKKGKDEKIKETDIEANDLTDGGKETFVVRNQNKKKEADGVLELFSSVLFALGFTLTPW